MAPCLESHTLEQEQLLQPSCGVHSCKLLHFSTNAVIKHRLPIYCCKIVEWPGGSVMGKNCKVFPVYKMKSCSGGRQKVVVYSFLPQMQTSGQLNAATTLLLGFIKQETGCSPELGWVFKKKKESYLVLRKKSNSGLSSLQCSHCTDYTIPAPQSIMQLPSNFYTCYILKVLHLLSYTGACHYSSESNVTNIVNVHISAFWKAQTCEQHNLISYSKEECKLKVMEFLSLGSRG